MPEFCHNNPWISIAETRIRRGNRVFEIYKKDLSCIYWRNQRDPPDRTICLLTDDCRKRCSETRRGQKQLADRNRCMDLCQRIPVYSGNPSGIWRIDIDPCIPSSLREFTVTRKFRDAVYHIHICNPNHVESGIVQMTVNGVPYKSNCITPQKDVREYQVEIVMG